MPMLLPTVNERYLERLKLGVDITKHLTTLTTGSVVVLASFADKALPNGAYNKYIIASLALLVCSLLASVFVLVSSIYLVNPYVSGTDDRRKPLTKVMVFTFLTSFIMFFLGIASAAIIAGLNALRIR